MAEIEGFHFIGPEDMPLATVQAVGSWTCSCGLFTSECKSGSSYVVGIVECPYCHEVAEILPIPSDGKEG